MEGKIDTVYISAPLGDKKTIKKKAIPKGRLYNGNHRGNACQVIKDA